MRGTITVQCSTGLAHRLGASLAPPMIIQKISLIPPPTIVLETDDGPMFWLVHSGSLVDSFGNPEKRRKGVPM
jgi:hypothetical protein